MRRYGARVERRVAVAAAAVAVLAFVAYLVAMQMMGTHAF